MSDFQQKDMEGVLFKNDEATAENKQPAFSGSVTIKGVKYNLGAWVNVGKKSGRKFFALKVQPWGKQETRKPEAPKAASQDFKDSDIPW
jgi:hypothetical protein